MTAVHSAVTCSVLVNQHHLTQVRCYPPSSFLCEYSTKELLGPFILLKILLILLLHFICFCLFLCKYFPFQRVARVLSILNLKIFSPLDLVMDSSSDKISSFYIGIFQRDFSVNPYSLPRHGPILFFSFFSPYV